LGGLSTPFDRQAAQHPESALKWSFAMPEESRIDDVEKFLSEEKSMEDRKQTLIADLLKQREVAIKSFDEKLAKLGYHANSSKTQRSHHKKQQEAAASMRQKLPDKGKA
jgi:hypothetical protein